MSAPRSGVASALLALAALAALGGAPAARAAGDGTANCTGFVSAAKTIMAQGVWCLSADLTDANPGGIAINVTTNNVTIDCAGHALVDTSGVGSTSVAIQADYGTNNLTVRGCEIRGFRMGVVTGGGTGTLVEDNRFRDIRASALLIEGGSANLVRRNVIVDTGGSTVAGAVPTVLRVSADVLDNVIDGIVSPPTGAPTAIVVGADDVEISRNTIRGFVEGAHPSEYGISAAGRQRVTIAENVVTSPNGKLASFGISGGSGGMCVRNQVVGFPTTIQNCTKLENVTP